MTACSAHDRYRSWRELRLLVTWTSKSRSRTCIAKHRPDFGDPGALERTAGDGRFKRDPLVQGVEYREIQRGPIPSKRVHARGASAVARKTTALARSKGDVPLQEEHLQFLGAFRK